MNFYWVIKCPYCDQVFNSVDERDQHKLFCNESY